jgi:hypothetical protein
MVNGWLPLSLEPPDWCGERFSSGSVGLVGWKEQAPQTARRFGPDLDVEVPVLGRSSEVSDIERLLHEIQLTGRQSNRETEMNRVKKTGTRSGIPVF